eukprot:3113820-Lingulodinium_polyedra.AAC.1
MEVARNLGPEAGMCVMLAHHCYLRPSELARLTWDQVVFAPAGFGLPRDTCTVLLHPRELGRASKTREFDESLVVDLKWLARTLRRMKRQASPSALL